MDILATYHTPPTAADLAPYRRQLRTALRLAGAAGATLAALDSRDKAARAAQPNSYARFSLPSDTNAASKAYDGFTAWRSMPPACYSPPVISPPNNWPRSSTRCAPRRKGGALRTSTTRAAVGGGMLFFWFSRPIQRPQLIR